MDVSAYWRRQREQYQHGAKLVKDFAVFDYGFIPDQPVVRDECKPILKALARFELSAIPNNLAAIGSRGSGKTLMLRKCAKTTSHFRFGGHGGSGEVRGWIV